MDEFYTLSYTKTGVYPPFYFHLIVFEDRYAKSNEARSIISTDSQYLRPMSRNMFTESPDTLPENGWYLAQVFLICVAGLNGVDVSHLAQILSRW